MTNKQTDANVSTELVARSVDLEALNVLEQAILTGEIAGGVVEQDPEQVSREIIAALLQADTDEELERMEAEGWRDYPGVPFEILGFVWRPSAFDEGQAVFLVVRAISTVDGSPHVLTTGSGQVMAQLVNLAKRGRLPVIRELVEKPTKTPGRTVCYLKTPDAIAAAAREQARTGSPEPAEPAAA